MSPTVLIAFLLGIASVTVVHGQRGGLALSSVAEFSSIPIREQSLSVVVSVVAPASVASASRAPVSVSAVLDRSGSMRGEKIRLLKLSTEFLVDRLTSNDFLGVVSYSSDVTEEFGLTATTQSAKGGLREAIDSIVASGSTNLAGGLFEGIDQQTRADIPGAVVQSIILFTDGLANTGVTDIGTITSRIANQLNGPRPPTVYALGFGGDHDAQFLQAIAEAGRGSYVFVQNENSIATAIGSILGGLLSVTAQDIVVRFTPLNGARIVAIRGGNVDAALTSTRFPDLFAEERRDVLVDMRIPVLDDALDRQEVLRVRLTYFNTVTEQREERETTVVVDRSLDVVAATAAPLVATTRLRFQVADDLTTAAQQRSAGDTAGASATLDGTLQKISDSSVAGTPEAEALAADVRSTQSEVESASFDTAAANRVQAGAASVSAQRAAAPTGLASAPVTTAQSASAGAALSFVSGGGN